MFAVAEQIHSEKVIAFEYALFENMYKLNDTNQYGKTYY